MSLSAPRRYRIPILIAILVVAVIVGSFLALMKPLTTHAAGNYRSYADSGMQALQALYSTSNGQWSNAEWWQQANILETTIDYMQQTNTTTYSSDIATTYSKNNGSNFLNGYYDDEGWWAVAWIKAYDFTGSSTYLNMAKTIFSDMVGGWSPSFCGGGIWWDKAHTYKNAIANSLFMQVAIRLHNRTSGDTTGGSGPGGKSYIDWANAELNWWWGTGWVNSQGLVNDGLNSSCQNNGGDPWTYNQGVPLGAFVDFYKATGNTDFLYDAESLANANNGYNIDSNGVLTDINCEPDCGVDGPMFKGIYMKNLMYLYQTDHQSAYQNFFIKNADSLWANDRNGSNYLGQHWSGPFDSVQGRRHAAGMDAIIGAIPFSTSGASWHTIEDTASGWTWNNFAQYSDSSCSGGTAHGNQDSGSGTYSFTGTGVRIYGWKGPDGGSIQIKIDNVVQGTASEQNGGDIYNQQLYSNTNLSNINHTLVITGLAGGWDMVDYIQVYN